MTSSRATDQTLTALARTLTASLKADVTLQGGFFTLEGRRVAVAAVPGDQAAAKLRLRDDRVARRFLADIEAAVSSAPNGRTAVLTLGAPIKVANQTLAELAPLLVSRLATGAEGSEERLDILGNRVRFCIVAQGATWASKLAGFVFTDDPSPLDLAKAFHALQETIAAAAKVQTSDRIAGERWLVLTGAWIADAATYRRVLPRLNLPEAFERVLMALPGGRFEVLTGEVP